MNRLLVSECAQLCTQWHRAYMRSIHWSRSTSSARHSQLGSLYFFSFFLLLSFWCAASLQDNIYKNWDDEKQFIKWVLILWIFFSLSFACYPFNNTKIQYKEQRCYSQNNNYSKYLCAIIMLLANTIITPHSFVMHSLKKKEWCWCVDVSCTIFRANYGCCRRAFMFFSFDLSVSVILSMRIVDGLPSVGHNWIITNYIKRPTNLETRDENLSTCKQWSMCKNCDSLFLQSSDRC